MENINLNEVAVTDVDRACHAATLAKGYRVTQGNIVYKVFEAVEKDGYNHLIIKKERGTPLSSFQVLMDIKNVVWGKDSMAVQVFPKEEDYVNNGNSYHLFGWKTIEGDVPNLKKLYDYNVQGQR